MYALCSLAPPRSQAPCLLSAPCRHLAVKHCGGPEAGLLCGGVRGGRLDAEIWAAQGHRSVFPVWCAGAAAHGRRLWGGVSALGPGHSACMQDTHAVGMCLCGELRYSMGRQAPEE